MPDYYNASGANTDQSQAAQQQNGGNALDALLGGQTFSLGRQTFALGSRVLTLKNDDPIAGIVVARVRKSTGWFYRVRFKWLFFSRHVWFDGYYLAAPIEGEA
jgi:hypothetical protein